MQNADLAVTPAVASPSTWVVVELSHDAEGQDPALIEHSIRRFIKDAEIFIPAVVSKVGSDRVVHYLVEGYCFIRNAHPYHIYRRLDGIKFVQAVLTAPGKNGVAATVKQSDIDRMKEQIDQEMNYGIRAGDEVLITSGPCRNMSGRVVATSHDTVQVHIHLLSKQMIVSVPKACVALVSRPSVVIDREKMASLLNLRTDTERMARWAEEVERCQIYDIPDLPKKMQLVDVRKVLKQATKLGRLNDRGYYLYQFVSLSNSPLVFPAPRFFEEVRRSLPVLQGLSNLKQRGYQLWSTVDLLSNPGSRVPSLKASTVKLETLQRWEGKIQAVGAVVERIGRMLEMADGYVDNLVIDGFNMAFRCMYAMGPAELTDEKGMKTGIVFGFLKSLLTLRKRFPKATFYVVWDGSSKRRKEEYPEYKANRAGSGEGRSDLSAQVALLREILPTLGVAQASHPEEEADDVIATLIRGNLAGKRNLVVSTDRDFLQLVTPTDVLFIPKVGTGKEKFYDIDSVVADYGVPPEKIPHLRAFTGDESDNFPRIPKVPSKVLAALVGAHGGVEGVYASSLAGLTSAQYDRVKAFERQARINLKLMRLRTDVPMVEVLPSPDEGSATTRLAALGIQPNSILPPFFAQQAQGFLKL